MIDETDPSRLYFLRGRRLGLRPLKSSDLSSSYLAWLNDSEVNRYSGRRFRPSTDKDIMRYLDGLARDEVVLAVCILENERHIGNIKYGPIDWPNRCSEIEILLGEKEEWGKGYASEAIYQITQYLFQTLRLNRVEAKSANPAFVKAVTEHLGWSIEGELRERFHSENGYMNYFIVSILFNDFQQIKKYE